MKQRITSHLASLLALSLTTMPLSGQPQAANPVRRAGLTDLSSILWSTQALAMGGIFGQSPTFVAPAVRVRQETERLLGITPADDRDPFRSGDLGAEWNLKVVEAAQQRGIVVVAGFSSRGKSLHFRHLFQFHVLGHWVIDPQASDRPVKVDDTKSTENAVLEFIRNHGGQTVVLDEWQELPDGTGLLPRFLEEARRNNVRLILTGLPRMEERADLRELRDWTGQPLAVVRVGDMGPAAMREKIEPHLAPGEPAMTEADWSRLHELVGGNLRYAWQILGLSMVIGGPVESIAAEKFLAVSTIEGRQTLPSLKYLVVRVFHNLEETMSTLLEETTEDGLLLLEAAREPLAADHLNTFSAEKQLTIQRLLDYGLLRISSGQHRIEVNGELFRHFLRDDAMLRRNGWRLTVIANAA